MNILEIFNNKITIIILFFTLIVILILLIINNAVNRKKTMSNREKEYKKHRSDFFTNDISNRKYYLDDEYFDLMLLYKDIDEKSIDLLQDEMEELINQNMQREIEEARQRAGI